MRFVTAALVALFVWQPHVARAGDFDCVMTLRSTSEGNESLADHQYHIRQVPGGFELTQRTADGSWMSHGIYQESTTDEFVVFTQLGSEGLAPLVSTMTVHTSGQTALVTHHGSWGNTSQYRKAWLTQGTCEPIQSY